MKKDKQSDNQKYKTADCTEGSANLLLCLHDIPTPTHMHTHQSNNLGYLFIYFNVQIFNNIFSHAL